MCYNAEGKKKTLKRKRKENYETFKMEKIYGSAVLCAVTAATAGPGLATVHADATGTPYVSLGADLDAGQRASVLELLGVSEADLEQYTVVTVTNEEEYEYLGDYLDAEVIGDQAISSALVVGREEGHGIQVTTQNVTYCTVGMYQNALATAGLKNADVTVAGPVKVTGTAALIGVMKAYSEMTGTPVEATKIDAATDELITTGDLGQSLGDTEQAENLVAGCEGSGCGGRYQRSGPDQPADRQRGGGDWGSILQKKRSSR